MMKQYVITKESYQDCILFYRLGDFYEMFFEDALIASKELEITLTGKDCGLEERAPMCGVPFHACDLYLNKLIEKGYKVAICEQVEDPKTAKGIVKREVVRVATPGTNLATQTLDETKNNYLMAIVSEKNQFGISLVDITTGDFYTTELTSLSKLYDEVNKFSPAEIICDENTLEAAHSFSIIKEKLNISVTALEDWYFDQTTCEVKVKEHFKVGSLNGLGLLDYKLGTFATGVLLQYLYETQKNSLSHLNRITPYVADNYLLIDSATRRNLEIIETLREKQKRGSLLWVLDKTKTAMGARLMRSYLEQPLIQKKEIEARYDAIEELNQNLMVREEIRDLLKNIYDLERLMTKVSYRSANPRDLIAFKTSIASLPELSTQLNQLQSSLFLQFREEFDELRDLFELIDASIVEEPPLTMKEGGIIKEGYKADLDDLKEAKIKGKTWLSDLEEQEREKTGIKTLKIKFNKVFGYYFEVTNSFKSLVPDYFIRKQTLANAERYTTDELTKIANAVLGSEEKLYALEYEVFVAIREELAAQIARVQKTAHVIAKLDVFTSLSYVAEQNQYVRPTINEEGTIHIKEGRHPVVEKMISNSQFITNDTYLDNNENRISIITGPNMAGKSTYMRQSALIVLMAQVGSFVPAREANIGICDRIFTRVGASDDLASGQSTFMVEMSEVANILRNATKNSLLILDEIGRGTSTFDGLSIAWAVVEYISNDKLLGAKTLFATHYHELTELEGKLCNVNNYCIAVKEQGDDIVFLRKIVKGGADKSYGIQVAKLAGVPDIVIERAKEIALHLTENDIVKKTDDLSEFTLPKQTVKVCEPVQLSLFNEKETEVIDKLSSADLSNMTPLQAMMLLNELQVLIRK
ncbi:MAG: DNA mismatch repair protein MutS [Lachnospiraceae bacterium]|nr:DNA mismatch repair protein MutS [Lachnospiraceae bacterium]